VLYTGPMGHFSTTASPLDDNRKFRPDPNDEARLIARLAAREGAAFGELYDRFGKITFAVVCRITGDEGVAEDLVQEVFLRIWANPTLYQAQKGTLFAWITAVARNRAIDYLRSTEGRLSHCRTDLDSIRFTLPSGPANSSSGDFQFDTCLTRAVKSLSPNQREVIRLAYYEGMSQTEMAAEMNQPLGTVKSWNRTALATLRRQVAPFQNTSTA
jgi:RNA polymerase sigma-70 factor (ECF subfamily)